MVEQMQVVRSPNYQDIYNNNSGMALTPYDASITFNRFVSFAGNQFLEELSTVRLSPQHLAILARSLSRASEAWQAEFGAIEIESIPGLTSAQMGEGLKKVRQALSQQSEQFITSLDSPNASPPQP